MKKEIEDVKKYLNLNTNIACISGKAGKGKTNMLKTLMDMLDQDCYFFLNGEKILKENYEYSNDEKIDIKISPILLIDETAYCLNHIPDLVDIILQRNKEDLVTIFTDNVSNRTNQKLKNSASIIEL